MEHSQEHSNLNHTMARHSWQAGLFETASLACIGLAVHALSTEKLGERGWGAASNQPSYQDSHIKGLDLHPQDTLPFCEAGPF